MGNSARKAAREKAAPKAPAARGGGGSRTQPPRPAVRPLDGDILYPATDLLHTTEASLAALRDQIALDSEGFLLDNLLMAVQYFKNYEKEASVAREAAGVRGAALAPLSCRVLRPDTLVEVAARHVRWRPRGADPDSQAAPSRRLVLSGSLLLQQHADDNRRHHCPDGTHYHLAVEPGSKPGLVKLSRLRRTCTGDTENLTDTELTDVDSFINYLRVPQQQQRGSGGGNRSPGRAPSPSDSVKSAPSPSVLAVESAPRRPRSVVDSVISSEGSATASMLSTISLSMSDLSTASAGRVPGRHRTDKHVPLDEFRPGDAVADINSLSEECFQAVLTPRVDLDVDADADGQASELRVQCYLMAAPYFARFTDAFHDHLAAAMGFPRESVVLATVHGGAGAPASVRCEEPQRGHCEVSPALALPRWPGAADEWVWRQRGAWPPRATVRAVHNLGGVAVPGASSDLTSLQWALAFPDGEQLLELSLPPAQAHGYLTLLALHRSMPGVSVAHLRALYLRQCESGVDQASGRKTSVTNMPWAPGRALKETLSALYTALQQRRLPDYFVKDRNLLAEAPTSQIRRAQERVFRLREKLLTSVMHAYRRMVYIHEDDFYPRLDLDKLISILSSSSDSNGDAHNLLQLSQDQQDDHDDLDWIASYRRRCLEEGARQAAAARHSKRPSISDVALVLGPHTYETKQRTISVLKLFCDHFIKMGEASVKFKANEQAWLYLRHSLHILTVLEQDYDCETDAKYFNSRVRRAEKELIDSAMTSLCGRQTTAFGSLGNLSSIGQQKNTAYRFGSVNVLDRL